MADEPEFTFIKIVTDAVTSNGMEGLFVPVVEEPAAPEFVAPSVVIVREPTDDQKIGYAYYNPETNNLNVILADYQTSFELNVDAFRDQLRLTHTMQAGKIGTVEVDYSKAAACAFYVPNAEDLAEGSEQIAKYPFIAVTKAPLCTNPKLAPSGLKGIPTKCGAAGICFTCPVYTPETWDTLITAYAGDGELFSLQSRHVTPRKPVYRITTDMTVEYHNTAQAHTAFETAIDDRLKANPDLVITTVEASDEISSYLEAILA